MIVGSCRALRCVTQGTIGAATTISYILNGQNLLAQKRSSMDIYRTIDVFTPTKPARVTFVERHSVNDRLVDALGTPGKQIIVYGPSGSGKTTLLVNKLHQIYEHHITTRCTKSTTFEQLLLDAFDRLNPYWTSERTSKQTHSTTPLQASYNNIRAQLGPSVTNEKAEKSQRLLPPQLTPQNLARFIGAVRACWVLEDFHKVQEPHKTHLAQMMKVFMDTADEFDTVRIIAIGAVATARQVIEYDPEMRNRVAELFVPLFH